MKYPCFYYLDHAPLVNPHSPSACGKGIDKLILFHAGIVYNICKQQKRKCRYGYRTASKLINNSSNIKWSKHCLERMQERDISIADVKSCLQTGEIIEDYPDDFPLPSCLVYGHTKENDILHVVVGSDNNSLFFITAYFPNTDKFEKDLKTRKGQ